MKLFIFASRNDNPHIYSCFYLWMQNCGYRRAPFLGTASAEKQRIAEEVASVLKLSVELDSSLSER